MMPSNGSSPEKTVKRIPPLDLSVIEGILERITYHNQENHYIVAKLSPDHPLKPITVVGFMPNPNLGERIKIQGTWETHPKYGQRLKIEMYEVLLPATVEGIRSLLSTGLIKGIGPKTAARIVGHFRENTLAIIEENPDRLTEVKGIGRDTATLIARAWKTHRSVHRLMQYLQEIGIQSAYGAKLLNLFGSEALTVLQNDPLRLSQEMPRIGFQIADAIMQHSGVSADDPQRIHACILHLLQNAAEQGHTCTPEESLHRRCADQFGIGWVQTQAGVDQLTSTKTIIAEKGADAPSGNRMLYLPSFHQAEIGIADRIRIMQTHPVDSPAMDAGQIAQAVLKKLALKLSNDQLAVLKSVLAHRVAIITGGPGTGKTTLIRSLAAVLHQSGQRVLLAAPTGRAARRLTMLAHMAAVTIHKMLGYNPSQQRFDKNRDNPLDADVIIIDEASMVDTRLMHHLIEAIHITTRLIIVGDVFQLPSVGPGNVLADLIRSQAIQTFELTEIFRQAQQSAIMVNAHQIRQGTVPDVVASSSRWFEGGEFYFIEKHQPAAAVDAMVALCTQHIAEHLGFDPLYDVQMLTPMHKGVAGAVNLNRILQERLNSHSVAATVMGRPYKLNDKVMHLKNNYVKEVFNGDIGYITAIDVQREKVTIAYENREIDYEFSEMGEVSLAYAISVHKSQGSEYPVVILPILTQQYAMLYRSLLYTAVTRAKNVVILVGSPKALAIAVQNDRPRKRITGLADRLAAL